MVCHGFSLKRPIHLPGPKMIRSLKGAAPGPAGLAGPAIIFHESQCTGELADGALSHLSADGSREMILADELG